MDVRGSEGLGDRMVGEESDLFSFGKLRKAVSLLLRKSIVHALYVADKMLRVEYN